jgi:hypothetical protein
MVYRTKSPARRNGLTTAPPSARDGAIALALFLLPWTVAPFLVWTRLEHGSLAPGISALSAVSIGLPTLWLTWAASRFRGTQDTSEQTLEDRLDGLSESMRLSARLVEQVQQSLRLEPRRLRS